MLQNMIYLKIITTSELKHKGKKQSLFSTHKLFIFYTNFSNDSKVHIRNEWWIIVLRKFNKQNVT